METEDIINFLLLTAFFSIILLYLSYSIPVNEYFENITPKDKIPTCSEAASAINQVMRFIASDITGDGMIVINNLKDTFFEIDNAKIGIKKTLEPDSLYNNWINPLNCKS